ncbi:hypothetical protein ACLSU7_13700 [Bdellovibrio sp. HCB185ZH]|uniref:hypothetical protein n=1 Tax=Bdellovibrio sp. HCB185ZH TaxID=3394235 RepID=UPI0039A73D12
MLSRWLTYISFACFGILSLVVLQMNQRPLCIDSKVVEKIDRTSGRHEDLVYRCAVNKATRYSTYFGENLRDLNLRIGATERLLESIEPFYQKVQLVILGDHPDMFRIKGHVIYMGQNLVEAPGHLEKALAKIWYRERNETLFVQQELMEEVATDFLVYLMAGDLDIGDPSTHVKTAILPVKWPYVIKSPEAYCDSPWKQSEDYEICASGQNLSSIAPEVLEMSLRPLLLNSWVKAYKSLSMGERYQFSRKMGLIIRGEYNPVLSVAGDSNASTLARATAVLKNFNQYVASADLTKTSNTYRLFAANFANELRSHGYEKAFAEASFDVLYVSNQKLSADTKAFQELLKIAKEQPQTQIALRDQENLWMLPSKFPIPIKTFGQIKANRTIVEKCGGYSFSYVMDYSDSTEKLLVVEHCDPKVEIKYREYLKSGAEGFALENKGMSFVQFHLPSLLMKRDELASVLNVQDFIKKRDVDNPSFKSLGWQEVRFSQTANAYQPKAYVDAIEWFRF